MLHGPQVHSQHDLFPTQQLRCD